MEKFHLIAPCYFGTESTTAFEARRLGAENVQVTDGRVAFEGGVDMIAAANLNLRCAERVVILLKTACISADIAAIPQWHPSRKRWLLPLPIWAVCAATP